MSSKLDNLVDLIINTSDEKKAHDIRSYRFDETTWITDIAIILGTSNVVHCKSIAESLSKEIKKHDWTEFFDDYKELGDPKSGWIIIDLGVVFIHIMTDETREFYKLDELFEQKATVFHH